MVTPWGTPEHVFVKQKSPGIVEIPGLDKGSGAGTRSRDLTIMSRANGTLEVGENRMIPRILGVVGTLKYAILR